MKVTFLGHSAFLIQGSKAIAVDPFITGNPAAKADASEIRADLVLVSHGHGDHLGDAVQIARQSGGEVIAVYELANYCARNGALAHGLHVGGGNNFDEVNIKLTPAWHGSGLGGDAGPAEYLGTPCGFIIRMDGKTIYHAGDTGLFGDMELIGRLNKIDLALLPIGDNYTMGPDDAVEAVKMLKPELVVPMHYNTFPLIQQDPERFRQLVESGTDSKVKVLQPGESFNL